MDEKSMSQTVKLLTALVLVMLSAQLIFGIVVIYQLQRVEQSLHEAMTQSSHEPQAQEASAETESLEKDDPFAKMRAELERLKALNEEAKEKYGHMPGFSEIFDEQDQDSSSTQPSPSDPENSSSDDRIKELMEKTKRLKEENERNKALIQQLPGLEDFDAENPAPTTQAEAVPIDPEALFQLIKEKNKEHGIEMDDAHIRLIVKKLIEDPDSIATLGEPDASPMDLFGSGETENGRSE